MQGDRLVLDAIAALQPAQISRQARYVLRQRLEKIRPHVGIARQKIQPAHADIGTEIDGARNVVADTVIFLGKAHHEASHVMKALHRDVTNSHWRA